MSQNLWKKFATLTVVALTASIAFGQYREESGALEQIYESRSRTALNTILRPNEYSIVVSVDINHDPKQLLEVENEVDKMNLPGVAGLTMPENMNVSNKLHELRNKISVYITLDEAVSKEKEAAVKTLTTMKLHLDESSGDTVVVGRALLIPKEQQPPAADLLPELSWRMWVLVVIVALLALGLFFALAFRKRQAEPEAVPEDSKKMEAEAEDEVSDEEAGKLAMAAEAEAQSEKDAQAIEIYEKKKALLSLATKYPEAAAKAVEEEFEKGHRREILLTFETMEWEVAKSLFRGLSHRTWVRLGAEIAAKTEVSSTAEYLKALELCYRSVVSKYLELADGDVENPFAFLVKLAPDDMLRLLSGQSPTDIASICVFLETNQKKALLELLSPEQQQATLLQITRLKEVPYEVVKKVSASLREKLQFIKDNPSISFDGQKFLIQLLRDLDVISEQRFIERLRRENPEEMVALRNSYLQFEDVPLITEDILSEAFSLLDMKVLTSSLYGADENIRFHCLRTLPEKRAKMVEKDLSYIQDLPLREVLSSQRVVLKTIHSILAAREKTPGDFIPSALELVTEAA